MIKKILACAGLLCLGFAFSAFSAFSLGSESTTVSIDGVVHTISAERIEGTSPLLIVKDEFISMDDKTKITVSATLTESYNLKCLAVSIEGSKGFVLSGETEITFPSGTKLSMFGKATTRGMGNDTSEESVTFLQGLDDLKARTGALHEGSFVMAEIFSKRGLSKSFRIPESFFMRLFP